VAVPVAVSVGLRVGVAVGIGVLVGEDVKEGGKMDDVNVGDGGNGVELKTAGG
jgi:hypothetical protein